MNILIVGGDFGDTPRASKIINAIHMGLFKVSEYTGSEITLYNGGTIRELEQIYNRTWQTQYYDAVLWFPNVPNSVERKYRDIKLHRSNLILITSKRNNDNEYSFQYLINHALGLRCNLFVEFNKEKYYDNSTVGTIYGTLYDPLGCCWCKRTQDFDLLAIKIYQRICFLKQLNRQTSQRITADYEYNVMLEPKINTLLSIIHESGQIFHNLILPDTNVTRFLGNASFRCTKGGFPSVRSANQSDLIFVSKRNIDKTCIDQTGFVPVLLQPDVDIPFGYFGVDKPSVDTPIQIQLYNKYPWVNYMLHSHVYIKDAPMTATNYPCGSLEEINEIGKYCPNELNEFTQGGISINLLGHGSIVLAHDIDYFNTVKYISRPIPENMF